MGRDKDEAESKSTIELEGKISSWKLGLVVYVCNLSVLGLRQEDCHKLGASLNYRMRSPSKKKKGKF